MTSRRLSETNPYLRDPAQRKRGVLKSIATSSAIEGIRAPFKTVAHTAAKSSSVSRRERQIKR